MFVVPGVVALFAGACITVFGGWEAFGLWMAKLDTRAEVKEFAYSLAIVVTGLCVFASAFHSLAG